jgi:hypothetical protein
MARFVRRLFAWVERHPRVKMLLYNQGNQSQRGTHLAAVRGEPPGRPIRPRPAALAPHAAERVVPAVDGRAHDAVAPLMGVDHQIDDPRTLPSGQPVGVDEEAQPLQRPATERLRRVALVAQRRP